MYREDQKENDLFYTCGLIEYMARQTHNTKKYIVDKLGIEKITHLYDLADIYHCQDKNQSMDEIMAGKGIERGNYDHVANARFEIPTHWDIGRVYTRLILALEAERRQDRMELLYDVLSSWFVEKLDNYNSSLYYENTSYHLESYKAGYLLP